MRELKFKVWDKVKQEMFKTHAITFDTQSLVPFAVRVPGRSWEPVSKFKLLQWTGLLDRAGAEVYEGDLILISSIVFQVTWSQATAGFHLVEHNGSLMQPISNVTSGDVVGNEFEKARSRR